MVGDIVIALNPINRADPPTDLGVFLAVIVNISDNFLFILNPHGITIWHHCCHMGPCIAPYN